MAFLAQAPTNPEQALQFYLQTLQSQPDCAEAYYDLADLLRKTSGDYYNEQSLVLYQKALELRPNWPDMYPDWRHAVKVLGEALMYPMERQEDGQQVLQAYIQAETEIAAAHPLGQQIRILSNYNCPFSIGHTCIELDIFTKMGLLGWRPPYQGVLLVPRQPANQTLLEYWKKYISVAQDPRHIQELEPLRKWLHHDTWYYRVPDGRVLPAYHTYAMVQKEWERQGRSHLLSLTEEHREKGWEVLQQMGIPKGAWFVCAHARELGFYKESQTSVTGAYRNVDIDSYIPAMQRIVDHGGWVIRVGDPSMKPLRPLPNVIDYVHSPAHSDWMDVFLAAECRFFLGCESGLMNLPSVFGVPCAIVGWTVFYSLPWFGCDLFITRVPYLRPQERVLTWNEMCEPPFRSGHRDRWAAEGLEMNENSPEEVIELVEEMLERLEGRASYTSEDLELQTLARKNIDLPISNGTNARVGRNFMRKYGRTLFRP